MVLGQTYNKIKALCKSDFSVVLFQISIWCIYEKKTNIYSKLGKSENKKKFKIDRMGWITRLAFNIITN